MTIQRVLKFAFRGEAPGEPITIDMPAGAVVLDVQEQHEIGPCLWALCDPMAPRGPRTFLVYATGQEIPDASTLRHITTFQSGRFVWHVFEQPFAAGSEEERGQFYPRALTDQPPCKRCDHSAYNHVWDPGKPDVKPYLGGCDLVDCMYGSYLGQVNPLQPERE